MYYIMITIANMHLIWLHIPSHRSLHATAVTQTQVVLLILHCIAAIEQCLRLQCAAVVLRGFLD
jgi:hypothetical protein